MEEIRKNPNIYDELDACAHNRNLRSIPFHFQNDINDLLDKNHTPYEETCLVCQSLFISLIEKNDNIKDKEVDLNGE